MSLEGVFKEKHKSYIGTVFLKKLGLDSIFTSRDLKNRIPRRKLRIQSYSQVETLKSRPKYRYMYFLKLIVCASRHPARRFRGLDAWRFRGL